MMKPMTRALKYCLPASSSEQSGVIGWSVGLRTVGHSSLLLLGLAWATGCGDVEPNGSTFVGTTTESNGSTGGSSALVSTQATGVAGSTSMGTTSSQTSGGSGANSTSASTTSHASTDRSTAGSSSSTASTAQTSSTDEGQASTSTSGSSQTVTGSTSSSEMGGSSEGSTQTSETALEVLPSPGCSGGNPNATVPGSEVIKPNGYDGSAPAPVLFAFHGAGGNAGSLQGPFANDGKERGYLGVYLKSTGSAWSVRDDTPLLDSAYDAIMDNYCVDMNRVYAVGHSSGAQMITQLLCAGEDRFRAVAPVASSKYCNGWDPTAAIVIHGVDDIERGGQGEMRYGLNDGDGHIDFGVYFESNECPDDATPFDPGGNCGPEINPGCVEYSGCAARTVFCNHDDPQYGTSNHGVPCFASQVMYDFFDEF